MSETLKADLVAAALFFGGLVVVNLVGKFDLPAAEVTAKIAAERDAEVARVRVIGFDPSRPVKPWDCAREGRQYVAWRFDGGRWIHQCIDGRIVVRLR